MSLLRRVQRDLPRWLGPFRRIFPSIKDVDRLCAQAGSRLDPAQILMVSATLAIVLALLATGVAGNIWTAVPVAPLGGMMPFVWLKIRRGRRYRDFVEGFPDALELMARSASAGHALPGTLGMVAEESPEPLATEFQRVSDEQKYGMSLRESLLGLGERVDTPDMRMFSTAILLHRETGGNLADTLHNLAYLMRERVKLGREVKTRSAHARMTGWVLGLTPFALIGLLQLVNPGYIAPLLTQMPGQALLGAALLLQGFGFLVIHRLAQLEV
jgi:tight adherence protein B